MEEKEMEKTEGAKGAQPHVVRMPFSKRNFPKKRADIGLIVLMILAVLAIICIIIVAIISKRFFSDPWFVDLVSPIFLK